MGLGRRHARSLAGRILVAALLVAFWGAAGAGVLELWCRYDGDYARHLAARARRQAMSQVARARPSWPSWLDFEAHPPADRRTIRLLGIGDSFTHGLGVALEDTWPSILESELRSRFAATPWRIEVLNGGLGAIGLEEELRRMRHGITALAPDVILHQLYVNDFYARPDARVRECPTLPPTARHFRAPRFDWHLPYYLWKARQLWVYQDRFVELVRCRTDPGSPAWARVVEILGEMRALVRAAGIPHVAFLAPSMHWRDRTYPFGDLHRVVADVVAPRVDAYRDLLPGLMAAFPSAYDHWLDPDLPDAHPDRAVQRFYAERVAELLDETGILTAQLRARVRRGAAAHARPGDAPA